ncbi:DUF4383 domain-containing protein [Streptomyces caelestis]|jgi:hypothetical protein|uniref:DUF4383 domain-containing protein n=1 Tax=Streptomyces caelestis TaxID=36816 RepID=A0A7W9H5X0_9ACTN|nr:DUF4383 domain-containing protein [Streptomyces caelestis]MBB5795909.1 hypothetical protein [Streptomyces caelestis]GGW74793.1 membrane protein [Streptomyces caelestis]
MTTHTSHRAAAAPVQRAAQLMGVVFLLVGVLGFIPGITTDYGSMEFASHESGAELLGVFQISVLHNLVHLAYGLVGLALSRTVAGAYSYLLVGGAVYLVLWVYGLIVGHDSDANFVPLNTADDWLHFALGIAMIGLALALGRRTTRTRRTGAER